MPIASLGGWHLSLKNRIFVQFWQFLDFDSIFLKNGPLFCPTPTFCRTRFSSIPDPHVRQCLNLYVSATWFSIGTDGPADFSAGCQDKNFPGNSSKIVSICGSFGFKADISRYNPITLCSYSLYGYRLELLCVWILNQKNNAKLCLESYEKKLKSNTCRRVCQDTLWGKVPLIQSMSAALLHT